jgi:hypothetical protein
MIVILACGGAKRSYPCIARAMYIGTYFRPCLKYALSICDPSRVFILSSKYGFIPLTRVIEPYNVRFGEAGALSQSAINESAVKEGLTEGRVLFIGAKDYFIRAKAAIQQAEWLTPMVGRDLGGTWFGCQFLWMKRNSGRNPFEEVAA